MTPRWTPEQETALHRHMVGDTTLAPTRVKCFGCFGIFPADALPDGRCPVCRDAAYVAPMCPLDHARCTHEAAGSIDHCPICGEPICPECGSHDVMQVSRITGYMADVAGWAAHKRQELKDRYRTHDIERHLL